MPESNDTPNDRFLQTRTSAVDLDIEIIEHQGERVLALQMIDRVHQRPDGTAGRNFRENRSRFLAGDDFYEIDQPDEIRRLGFQRPQGGLPSKVILLSESGYLMLVKSFTDDLAWEVQRKLVKSYFRKATPSVRPLPVARPRVDLARECRLTLNQNLRLAKMIGLTGNQAALSANRATVAVTGIDTLHLMGAGHITAPQNEALLSPRDIGHRSGLGSAQTVNRRLCELGLQYEGRDLKNRVYYEPTKAGIEAGGVMQDTGKKHSTGTPVRQLRWASSIVRRLTSADLLESVE